MEAALRGMSMVFILRYAEQPKQNWKRSQWERHTKMMADADALLERFKDFVMDESHIVAALGERPAQVAELWKARNHFIAQHTYPENGDDTIGDDMDALLKVALDLGRQLERQEAGL